LIGKQTKRNVINLIYIAFQNLIEHVKPQKPTPSIGTYTIVKNFWTISSVTFFDCYPTLVAFLIAFHNVVWLLNKAYKFHLLCKQSSCTYTYYYVIDFSFSSTKHVCTSNPQYNITCRKPL